MQQVICFFVSICMFSSLFVASANSLSEKQQSRIAKQNFNLSGRDIVNHINSDAELIKINEREYLNSIEKMIGKAKLIGGIFCYRDRLCVLKKEKEEKEVIIDISLMNEFNKRNTINNLVNYLLEKEDIKADINMAVENEEDHLTETLFNKLEENTVFIIGKMGKNVILSGFVVDTM